MVEVVYSITDWGVIGVNEGEPVTMTGDRAGTVVVSWEGTSVVEIEEPADPIMYDEFVETAGFDVD